jgi:hypothetical protein
MQIPSFEVALSVDPHQPTIRIGLVPNASVEFGKIVESKLDATPAVILVERGVRVATERALTMIGKVDSELAAYRTFAMLPTGSPPSLAVKAPTALGAAIHQATVGYLDLLAAPTPAQIPPMPLPFCSCFLDDREPSELCSRLKMVASCRHHRRVQATA